MKILAIETSCDETAAAIVEDQNYRPVVLSEVVASQMEVHAETGGVVPNIAARLHTEALPQVLAQVTNKKRLDFDAVAVTVGPGLIGSLLVGVAAAKSIAMSKDLPFFAINHLEGHIYSAWLNEQLPELPAIIVIVSGGHTELVLMERHGVYQHLGSTRDDAAGEAFDKVARLLELGYPGGPEIAKLALHGARDAYQFPIGLDERDSLEFSFSGLKASVYSLLQKLPTPLPEHTKADIAASFEHTVAATIARKTLTAIGNYPELRSVCLVGGVAANRYLRTYLEQAINQRKPDVRFSIAPLNYCTDNAAMIGAAAVYHHLFGKPDSWYASQANPSLEL
jgi:N6-L-threonylcarbamoyladenine synthase